MQRVQRDRVPRGHLIFDLGRHVVVARGDIVIAAGDAEGDVGITAARGREPASSALGESALIAAADAG